MSPSASVKSQKASKEEDDTNKQQFKITIRRLPKGFNYEELMHQLEPLDGCVCSWFRKANKLMEPWSFTRAYLVFDDWEKALIFKDKFNGYVFIDKDGNESAAIVELTVHQEIPKSFLADAAKNDRRVGTLEERPEYKAFLEDFNNLILHKVTDFDELISQIEEKEKKMEKGMISETPLVKFLVQQAVEKEKKRIERMKKHKPSMLQKAEEDSKKKVPREEKKNHKKEYRNSKSKEEEKKVQEKPKENGQKTEEKSDTNGVPRRRPKEKTKEYSEFGNIKPKVLNRSQKNDDQLPELPRNDPEVPKTSEKSNDVRKEETSQEGTSDEKRRRRNRPERQLYQPPRNRDAGKKEKTPQSDETATT